jgi:hypothetical protein
MNPSNPLARTPAPALLVAAVALLGACGVEPAGPNLPPEPQGYVSGRVHALGTVSSSGSGLTVRVAWNGHARSVTVASDGSFAVPVFGDMSGFGALTIEPDADAGVHAAYVPITPGDVGGQLHLALVPRRWTIRAGDYAGTSVPIDPDLAADSRVMPSFWGFYFPFTQEGALQTITSASLWSGELRTWPAKAFPVSVVLDRPASNAKIEARDSAAFWAHVETLEAALGRDVFEPATLDDVPILSGTRRALNTVLVQVDTAQAVEGYGDADAPDAWSWHFGADAESWSGSPVRRVEAGSADMNGARLRLRDPQLLSHRRIVIHELMHVLGAGHGCSWASVQTYCASLATDIPTPADVAHLEVLEAVRALEATTGARWGLLAAVMGHRAVTLGLPPVPGPSLVYGPGAAGPYRH